MQRGDTVYISSSSGVEEGVVTVAHPWSLNVRIDGCVRKGLRPDTVHATREAAEVAVIGVRAVEAESRIRSARHAAKAARDSLSSAQSALRQALAAVKAAEANIAKEDAAVVAAEEGAIEAATKLAEVQFGPGVSVTLTETTPDGVEVMDLHHTGRFIGVRDELYGFGYIVVRPQGSERGTT